MANEAITIPSWAVRVGSILLSMMIAAGSVWLGMRSALDKQETRLGVVERELDLLRGKADAITGIQTDIKYLIAGQKRVEESLEKLR